MVFSRIGSLFSRSTRSTFQKNVVSREYNARAAVSKESIVPLKSRENVCISCVDGGLSLVRGCVTSAGAEKQLASNIYLWNLNSIFANPGLRHFFSSEAPKKGKYENYYPRTKGKSQKQTSKDLSQKRIQVPLIMGISKASLGSLIIWLVLWH